MNKHIFVNGVGISSKHGENISTFWNSLIKKETVHNPNNDIFNFHQYFENYHQYFYDTCVRAIKKAAEDAHLSINNCKKGCIILGTGMGLGDSFLKESCVEYHTTYQISTAVKKQLDYDGKVVVISNSCSSGAQAIAYACDLLQSGSYDYIIAGGVEVYSKIVYYGFQRLHALDPSGCKPFDKNRKGIHIGDGAAFFVLCVQPSNTTYCKILGRAVTNDAYHPVSIEPSGIQIAHAISLALQRADVSAKEVDAVVAHGTGTKANDTVEAQVLHRIFGKIPVTAPKEKIGHTGGASGAFGLAEAICILRYQSVPPVLHCKEAEFQNELEFHGVQNRNITKVLVNTFAFGGTNVILLCGGIMC